jgi:molecular chaperone GrpE
MDSSIDDNKDLNENNETSSESSLKEEPSPVPNPLPESSMETNSDVLESEDLEKEPTNEELKLEIDSLKDQLLRSLAEGENVRRRTERERKDASKYAITNFAREIISVADNLDRALTSVSEEKIGQNEDLKNLFIGIQMTQTQFINSLEQFNISVLSTAGQKFDHNLHQAMYEIEDTSSPAGLVLEEVQKGYMLHDRLLRPAMVGVSKGGVKLDSAKDDKSAIETPKEATANTSSSAYEKQADALDASVDEKNKKLDEEL